MRKAIRFLSLLATLPLVLQACGASAETTPDSTAPPEEAGATVRTLTVQAAEVTDMAVLSADLLPARRATLAAEVSGTVEELRVDIGDRVVRGSLMAKIDTRAARQQVAEAEALFRQALDRFERAEKLFAKRSITKEQQIDATASRDVAEARLASAKLALEKSEIKAPWSGTVSARHVEIGDYAGPGQPILDLVAVDRLKVRAPASAVDVPYLAIGAPVRVTVDVLPGEVFTGKVVRLGAELDPSTRTLDIEAEIDNSDGRLRPGYFGRLEVPRRVIANAILVPLTSIVDFEDYQAVYVVDGELARRRQIELGPTLGENVVVTKGVSDGERVIVTGLQQVVDGLKVTEEGAG
jgi:membrane fusion protein (multidrug efflux system)